jgi:hypothetical protein
MTNTFIDRMQTCGTLEAEIQSLREARDNAPNDLHRDCLQGMLEEKLKEILPFDEIKYMNN